MTFAELFAAFVGWMAAPPRPAPHGVEPRVKQPRAGVKVSAFQAAVANAGAAPAPKFGLEMPTYAPGVLPNGRTRMAMDDVGGGQPMLDYANSFHGLWAEGIGFAGYPYLAELAQRPEYRRPAEVIAEEMTRKWIKLTAIGGTDKTAKLAALDAALKRFKVRELFRDAIETDGLFGRAQIYIDTGAGDDSDELQVPLPRTSAKIGKGELKGFKLIDPMWTAPNDYNSSDPLDPHYYRPQTWFIMARRVHWSRLITMVSRPVPDILKPAYNFGGLSLSQMLKPYVDNWLRTRQSVSDLLASFTVFVLQTNMQAMLEEDGADGLANRADMFTRYRTNRGLMVIDKDTETFQNVSAALGGLDHLQAQAQEHQAGIAGIPLVKLLSITPSGLNTSTDGEIRVFYDTINARQERLLTDPMNVVLEVIQLNEFGSIDPDIGFEFVALWQLDDAGKASVAKTMADTDAVLSSLGAIDADDVRTRIAAAPDTPYAGLEGAAPGPPDTGAPLSPNTSDPAERITGAAARGETSGANNGDAAFDAWNAPTHLLDGKVKSK